MTKSIPPVPTMPTDPHYSICEARHMKGKTVKTVDFGDRKVSNGTHPSEQIVIHFTDGTALSIDTGSNMNEKPNKPDDLRVSFLLEWFNK